MSKILNGFIMQHKTHINNFQDFLRVFIDYYLHSDIRNSDSIRLHESQNSNIFQSGLAIDIGGLDFSDDSQKQEQMLNSPAFQYYINMTNNMGSELIKTTQVLLSRI